jgi:hypothetical protein
MQYTKALHQMVTIDPSLDNNFLIAQSNNMDTFFDLIESMLTPMRKEKVCTEDEIEDHFDQRALM